MQVLVLYFSKGGNTRVLAEDYGVACVGKPDEAVLENGKKLGRRVAELCLKVG
ncbi:hypothetical protein Dalk_4224 [Desulfatibacillum aliphaticivorans]|uniref:Flavodoxin n=1 Tax=Desulfatibacillum aliphaticivorans TaxID=218208 RepID=B8FN36_DESAL|nr:hypothetical protein [Desulfatibacillum aliphaticivorans]ACL05906.1 hypothetical protein Dalk_4224 [Desulfatibacillum aliphaticivorans]